MDEKALPAIAEADLKAAKAFLTSVRAEDRVRRMTDRDGSVPLRHGIARARARARARHET